MDTVVNDKTSESDTESGYEADINIVRTSDPESQALDQYFDPQPCVKHAFSLELEILRDCEAEVEPTVYEESPLLECLLLEAKTERHVDANNGENAHEALPCGWPASGEALQDVLDPIHLRIHQISEEQHKMLKERCKIHYNYAATKGYLSCDTAEDDPVLDLLENEELFVVDDDVYLDVTALYASCLSSQREEYGRSNLSGDDFEKSLQKHDQRIREVLERQKEVFGPLLPAASVEKLVTMDLELLDDHQGASVRSRPFPASVEDAKEIMRQIHECVTANLAEEYKKTEYPKHCSPCFLVDKPGSTAKRLVVHYGKLNKLTKRHSGTLPSLEQALERASACRYKSKLDKRSGFWQVEMTPRAQDLSAFVAPNGQVFKWKVMPFGLSNAPATFQELMNQVLSRTKRKASVQELLKRGAVIEAYIDDVLLGTDTVEDHPKLVDEFLRTCQECNTRVKLEKCEFLKENLEYLGFEVGWRWWRPVEEKVAPILKATIRNDKTKGVKDIRSFLGACNFYRRHLPNFTYSSHLLTDLTKKDKKWLWGEEEAKQFDELKTKLGSVGLLGTPNADGEFVVISDASQVGGGGTLFQWQRLPQVAASTIADEVKRTTGINRDGTLKHNYDPERWHLVPLGHWNWKWSPTRMNYSTYERELLAGILLLSGQSRLLGTNLIVWFCDQESTEYFLKGNPPENRKLRRWWTYLVQLRLNIHRVPGLKNELCDWLSRERFDDKISQSSEELSKEAFQRMDIHLDLSMSKVELLDSIRRKDYEEEYPKVMEALKTRDWIILEGAMWSISSKGLLRRETQTCLPKSKVVPALQWRHTRNGHQGPDQWFWDFTKYFHTVQEDKNVKGTIRELYDECRECIMSKRNRPSDRGLVGALPIPHMVNTQVYVDFIDRPRCENYDYALMVVDGLSLFCQVIPCKKTIDGEGVLKAILKHWVRFYQPMVRIHSDRDIRFTGDRGWYLNVFRALGVEVSFGQPYRPQSNGLCERMNDEYQETLRILRSSVRTSNWVQLNDYAVVLMNNKQRGKTGISRSELFLGRKTCHLEMPYPHEGHSSVDTWIQDHNAIAKAVQENLQRTREQRVRRANKGRKPARYAPGDYVLVSRHRFPSRPVPKGGAKDILWYGPYLVVGTTAGGVVARCSPTLGGEVPVAHEFLKRFPFELIDEDVGDGDLEDGEMDEKEAAALEDKEDLVHTEDSIPYFNVKEMKKQGNYLVEKLLKADYRQGWRFLTLWKGYPVSDATWEPVKAFVHEDGKLNELFVEFWLRGSPKFDSALRAAKRISKRLKEQQEEEHSRNTSKNMEKEGVATSFPSEGHSGSSSVPALESDLQPLPAQTTLAEEKKNTRKRTGRDKSMQKSTVGTNRTLVGVRRNPLGFVFS